MCRAWRPARSRNLSRGLRSLQNRRQTATRTDPVPSLLKPCSVLRRPRTSNTPEERPIQEYRGAARSVRVRVDGGVPVAVSWPRRSETNRPSKSLEDTRGELARKGLTHRRMSNDSPKIKWSCQRVNEQVGVGILRQFSGRNGLLDQI